MPSNLNGARYLRVEVWLSQFNDAQQRIQLW